MGSETPTEQIATASEQSKRWTDQSNVNEDQKNQILVCIVASMDEK